MALKRYAAAFGLLCLTILATGCAVVSLFSGQSSKDDAPRCTEPSARVDGGDCRQAAGETDPIYCFRTIGIVDCYDDIDPYGVTTTGRALTHPIVRPD